MLANQIGGGGGRWRRKSARRAECYGGLRRVHSYARLTAAYVKYGMLANVGDGVRRRRQAMGRMYGAGTSNGMGCTATAQLCAIQRAGVDGAAS